ncbi:hypothetical protein BCR42DRAFT_459964 [Absidia repens]|uniref:Uncharacterized protein n=1 Tax=Absidia repens TaxID=90262 RepID=A0A1X2IPD0_9FUNG|nr:hypothetical protein BCR42DRAFT_459964 [Absidia repens]
MVYIHECQSEQKLAVARCIQFVLAQNESKLGANWTIPWWQKVLPRIGLTTEDKTTSTSLSLQQAVELVSKPKDIRIDILLDLLSIALNVDEASTKGDKGPTDIIYDARTRQFLYFLTIAMGLNGQELSVVEKSLGQQMYFTLQEKSNGEIGPGDQSAQMNSSAKSSMAQNNSKKKMFRWLATGAGVVGGGAVIALTGGLAAPLLAPLIVGLTGATFFATAGGIALVTSLFGLTALEGSREPTDTFCLEYEKETLQELGYAFRKFLANSALKYAGMEVAKQTALHAFFAAVALPATLLKVADVIDSPWQVAVDRSRKAGIELYRREIYGAIDHVVLMGAPIPSDDAELWGNAKSVVAGRFVNCYTADDWVLAYVYRLHSLETKVSGLAPVPFDGIENVSLDLDGHTSYRDGIPSIMSQINLE